MKWVLAATAPDQLMAEMWGGLLANQGIPFRLSPGDTSAFLGLSLRPCGIQVQEDRLEEARLVLEGEDIGSAEDYGPGEEAEEEQG